MFHSEGVQRTEMGRLIIAVTLAILVLSATDSISADSKPKNHLASEKTYQDAWCNKFKGVTGVSLRDGTIVDCVTEEYVVEVDFARKFYEAIGQSLHYSTQADKKSAILLIVEKPSEEVYLNRLHKVVEQFKLPIKVFVIRPEDVPGLIQ